MKRRKRRAKPEPIAVEVPAIAIDTFSLLFPNGERWIFNRTKARQLVRIPPRREIHYLDHPQLGLLIQDLVAGRAFDQQTIDAADPRIPGIAAVLDYCGQRRLNLIDGLERAIRAFVTNQGFPVYVLDDVEREACLWSRTGLKGVAESVAKGKL